MKYLLSYGIALVIILVIAAWLVTGNYVQGGRGPGNGEQSIVGILEPEGGPLTSIVGEPEEHHDEGGIDPHLTIAERNVENEGGAEGTLRSVRIEQFAIQAFPLEVDLRGRTEATATVSAVAETNGTLDIMHVSKGQFVEADQLLCTIDRGTREARLKQAEASLAQAELALVQAEENSANNATLREKGVATANSARQFEVALTAAQASVSAAQSGLDEAEAELERTEIRARVAGIVTDPVASVGEVMGAGAVCVTIVQLDPILFIGDVPEARISLARLNLPVEIETVSGESLSGAVSYISPVADPDTRSFKVEVSAENLNGKVRDGLTASATVNLGTVPAHLIPQSVLTLNNEGQLGVRSVADGVVEFHAIEIISDTREGVWVAGLPAVLDIITLGQENVLPGMKVDARTREEMTEMEESEADSEGA